MTQQAREEAKQALDKLESTEREAALACLEAERGALRQSRVAARAALQQQEIAVVRETERQRAAQ